MLWRVLVNSSPTFPRPTISLIKLFSDGGWDDSPTSGSERISRQLSLRLKGTFEIMDINISITEMNQFD